MTSTQYTRNFTSPNSNAMKNEEGPVGKVAADQSVAAIKAFLKVVEGDKNPHLNYNRIVNCTDDLSSKIAILGTMLQRNMCDELLNTIKDFENFFKQLTMGIQASQRDGFVSRVWKDMHGDYKDATAAIDIQFGGLRDRFEWSMKVQTRKTLAESQKEDAEMIGGLKKLRDAVNHNALDEEVFVARSNKHDRR